MAKATAIICLTYDSKSLEFMLGKPITDDEFEDEVETLIYEDLRNYLMSEPLRNFASIEYEYEEDEE